VILFGSFLAALAKILHLVLMLYLWIVIIRAVLSWVNVPSLYPVILILYRLTEPVLRPFRRFFPPRRLGGIDISPIIVVLIIVFVDSFIVGSLALYAQRLLAGARLPY
jgi:YggT family protein